MQRSARRATCWGKTPDVFAAVQQQMMYVPR
jgi:hypothetical protein